MDDESRRWIDRLDRDIRDLRDDFDEWRKEVRGGRRWAIGAVIVPGLSILVTIVGIAYTALH